MIQMTKTMVIREEGKIYPFVVGGAWHRTETHWGPTSTPSDNWGSVIGFRCWRKGQQ